MVRLAGIDAKDIGQRPVIHLERAAHLGHACLAQIGRHCSKRIRIQQRVRAAHKDQIALQNAVLDRATGQQPGLEPMLGPKNIQRMERRQGLGDTGRRQPGIALDRL